MIQPIAACYGRFNSLNALEDLIIGDDSEPDEVSDELIELYDDIIGDSLVIVDSMQ